MREMTGTEETVSRIRTERPYTLLFRFLERRRDDLLLFLAEQTCVSGMRVQGQHGDAGFL